MKKSLAIVSLALGAALSLAACNKSDNADNAAATDNATTDVTAGEGNGLEASALDANDAGADTILSNADTGLSTNSSAITNTQ